MSDLQMESRGATTINTIRGESSFPAAFRGAHVFPEGGGEGYTRHPGRISRGHSTGFLLFATEKNTLEEPLGLLAEHLDAKMLGWSESKGQIEESWSMSNQDILLVGNLLNAPTFEQIEAFETFSRELSALEPARSFHRVIVLDPSHARNVKSALSFERYPLYNHFDIQDVQSLLQFDPDFWIHDRLAVVSRNEGVQVSAISESLAILLETNLWRYGWLEMDLVFRDLIRNAQGARQLDLSHLPQWFQNPLFAQLERQTLEILAKFKDR